MSDKGYSYLAQGCTQCGIWHGKTRVRPAFVRHGIFWHCPMCNASYGAIEKTKPSTPTRHSTMPAAQQVAEAKTEDTKRLDWLAGRVKCVIGRTMLDDTSGPEQWRAAIDRAAQEAKS